MGETTTGIVTAEVGSGRSAFLPFASSSSIALPEILTSTALVARGVNVLVLLALGGDGKPASHEGHAQSLASMGIPVFACTPDLFPDLMAAALKRHDIADWAARNDRVLRRAT